MAADTSAQQILESYTDVRRDQGTSSGALHEISQFGGATRFSSAVCLRFCGNALLVTDWCTHCHS